MKKLIFIGLLFFALTNVNGQSDSLKPIEGNWGLSITINGLINNIGVQNNKDINGNYQIFARRYLKNQKALRVGLGINYLKQKWFNSDSVSLTSGSRALQEIDSVRKNLDFSIAIGLEKHLGNTKRLDPYLGGDIIIGKLGAIKTDVNTNLTDVTGTEKIKRIIQQDGGFSFGLLGIAGFNFFFSKNLSLGTEFSFGYIYQKLGGDYSESLVDTPVSGQEVSTFNNGKSSTTDVSITVNTSANLVLSFFF